MAPPFPFYDELQIDMAKNPQVDINWKDLTPKINNLSKRNFEIIFALIYHHHELESEPKSKNSRFDLPYGGEIVKGGRGFLYTISQLPIDLQKLIYEFVRRVI